MKISDFVYRAFIWEIGVKNQSQKIHLENAPACVAWE